MNVATAFSGGLAACEFALKYENIKHEMIFACEWDKYARKQYLKFHDAPNTFYKDISDLDARKYKGKIDLFVWGSPCQDVSLAGNRKGFDGEKSSLFREGARVLSEMKPNVFIFENVKGLLSSNNGNDYREVLHTFREMGYLIATKVLNAKEHGTAQNRERIFIVGFLDENDYQKFYFEPAIKLTKTLRNYLDSDVDEKYYLSAKLIVGFMKKTGSFNSDMFKPLDKDSKSIGCITARYHKCAITDPYIKEPQLTQTGKIGESQGDRVYDTSMACTLKANGGGGGAKTGLYLIKSATKKGYEVATKNDSINFTFPSSKTRRGRVGKGIAQTIDTTCNQAVIVINGEAFRIRRLTPRECFRLQGVKDKDIKLVNSDTQSYKIVGNGIEVNTIRSILRSLYKSKVINLFSEIA